MNIKEEFKLLRDNADTIESTLYSLREQIGLEIDEHFQEVREIVVCVLIEYSSDTENTMPIIYLDIFVKCIEDITEEQLNQLEPQITDWIKKQLQNNSINYQIDVDIETATISV